MTDEQRKSTNSYITAPLDLVKTRIKNYSVSEAKPIVDILIGASQAELKIGLDNIIKDAFEESDKILMMNLPSV